MTPSIVIAAAAAAELKPAPITPDWIVSGSPVARNMMLASSQDRTARIVIWECTPGRFNWHYHEDETVMIVAGEVFITQVDGPERRLGPGDIAFFPAGCSAHWHVTSKVRKVATLRSNLPKPLAVGLRIWRKLLRIMEPKSQPQMLMPLIMLWAGI